MRNGSMESTISAFHGSENLEGVDIKNLSTGEQYNFKTGGAFIFIAYLPNTEFFRVQSRFEQMGRNHSRE